MGQGEFISWFQLGLILFGFSSASGVVGVPYTIGTCGLVLGPVVACVVTLATCCGALMLNEMIVSLEGCEPQLEDLGRHVLGGGVWGRCIQQGNFVLYMPVALLICAEAVQGFAEPSGETCVDLIVVVVGLFCFGLTQCRKLSGAAASALSYVSLACVAVVVAILLAIVLTHNEDRDRARLFGNPDMFSSRSLVRERGYAKLCLGASTTAWAYVPTFLTVELSRALERPRQDFAKALCFSAALNVLTFFVVGVTTVHHWGWDVTDPVMASAEWPQASHPGRALYFFWFIATAVTYAFSSMALTSACQLRWVPTFAVDDWSMASCATWAVIALPGFLVALALALVVPSLFAMLAVTTALTVPWVNHIYPAILYMRFVEQRRNQGDYRRIEDRVSDDEPTVFITKIPPRLLVAFTLAVGVLIFLACTFGAAEKLIDHQLRGPMSIGCPSWYLFEDDLTRAD